jgi:hypothetical protein
MPAHAHATERDDEVTPRGLADRLLLEVSPSSEWCQRWNARAHSWRHTSEGGFDPRRYTVEPITETAARSWVVEHHYSGSYPAASRRYGLLDGDGTLLGVCVLGIPMSRAVLTNVFPDLEPMVESLELSRLVLADAVPANAESWFIARAFSDAALHGVRGVVAFADPVPRTLVGRTVFPGHRGVIYMASNAAYLGRSTTRTLILLPNGQTLSARSAQKIRRHERGHRHVERHLVALGAAARRPSQSGTDWLAEALHQVGATRLRHRGNHRYAFRLGSNARARARVRLGMPGGAYPASVDATRLR